MALLDNFCTVNKINEKGGVLNLAHQQYNPWLHAKVYSGKGSKAVLRYWCLKMPYSLYHVLFRH
jgi:hypothetical protein